MVPTYPVEFEQQQQQQQQQQQRGAASAAGAEAPAPEPSSKFTREMQWRRDAAVRAWAPAAAAALAAGWRGPAGAGLPPLLLPQLPACMAVPPPPESSRAVFLGELPIDSRCLPRVVLRLLAVEAEGARGTGGGGAGGCCHWAGAAAELVQAQLQGGKRT